MTSNRTTYVGHEVVDVHQTTIGTVTDVLYDESENEPKWLVVNPGALQKERYVPIEGSYESESGELVVPFDKKWVKSAPKVSGDHILTAIEETEIKRHYEIIDS